MPKFITLKVDRVNLTTKTISINLDQVAYAIIWDLAEHPSFQLVYIGGSSLDVHGAEKSLADIFSGFVRLSLLGSQHKIVYVNPNAVHLIYPFPKPAEGAGLQFGTPHAISVGMPYDSVVGAIAATRADDRSIPHV